MVGNVIIKFQLFLTLIFEFLRPQKIVSSSIAAILNFSKTLKSHLHSVGNVIVNLNNFLLSFFPTKNMKLIRGGHFEFKLNLKKITCTSLYQGNVIVKFV